MATRDIFTPERATYPATNFPQYKKDSQDNTVLAFDASTDETCYFRTVAPQGLSGSQSLIIYYRMASATSGNLYWQAAVEAVTPGDAFDSDAGQSFDTANSGNGTVPGTAGYIQAITVTLTNADSMAAGDLVRFKLNRDADNASDTATGDAEILVVEWRDSA